MYICGYICVCDVQIRLEHASPSFFLALSLSMCVCAIQIGTDHASPPLKRIMCMVGVYLYPHKHTYIIVYMYMYIYI